MASCFGVRRFVYNEILNIKSNYKKSADAYFSIGDASKALTEIKKDRDFEWLAEVPVTLITQSLRDLDKAYNNFFNKIGKYPRYKKRVGKQSCRMQMDQRQIERNFKFGEIFKLPRLGNCKLVWSRNVIGRPKMATISRNPDGKYFISFMCEEEIVQYPKTGKSVGIDLGINAWITDSLGNKTDNPRNTNKYACQLALAQRRLARKKLGSNRRNRQRKAVARIHAKIINSRLDSMHKLTTNLVREFDIIATETLAVKNMIRNHKLAKALADVSFGKIVEQLEYKCQWHDKTLIKIDQWFPSTKMCSGCGCINDMPLQNRTLECDCGVTLDRDHNAAINILAEGIRSLNVEESTTVVINKSQQADPMKRMISIVDSNNKAGAEVV